MPAFDSLHVHQGSVAVIDEVSSWEQVPALRPGVDASCGRGVGVGGVHGCDVGVDVEAIVGAGLGHMDKAAYPAGNLTVTGVAGG